MPHVSRKLLDKSTYKLLNSLITSTLSNLTNKEAEKLIGVVISKTEAEMIKKRLGIILLLELGVNFQDISEITKTTHQTVTRITFVWAQAPESSKKIIRRRIKRVYSKQKIKEIISALSDINISRSHFRRKIAGLGER